MPTAPESLPKRSCSKASSSRVRLRSASKAKPARRRPKVVGSAWTPWVRPTQSVSRCSSARSIKRVAVGPRRADHDLAGLAQLQSQRRVEHVGGGEAVMDPAPVLADRLRDDVDEGGDVMVGHLLALVDRLNRERRVRARSLRRLPRNHPLLSPSLGSRQLHLQPALQLPLRAPNTRHLRPRIPGDHRTPPLARVARRRGPPIAEGSRSESEHMGEGRRDRTRAPLLMR